MSRDWDTVLRSWSSPSSDTEDQKCKNAERMVKDAISNDDILSKHRIEVFAQGSYRNNTNVRLESDVDICVRLMDTFSPNYIHANGLTNELLGFIDSTYTYPRFKNDVERALKNKFGIESVRRGNKAFDIHANSYRVDADVVACLEHRLYTLQKSNGEYFYHSGAELRPDNGMPIVNWPHQHYENGVSKNNATGYRFKYLVRGLKRLRNEMVENGIESAKPISSYLIECLVWNSSNDSFGHTDYLDDAKSILAHTYNATITEASSKEWLEVNKIKYLFHVTQPWTLDQAHEFMGSAWNYIGLN